MEFVIFWMLFAGWLALLTYLSVTVRTMFVLLKKEEYKTKGHTVVGFIIAIGLLFFGGGNGFIELWREIAHGCGVN